jgi:hypothetical protein
MELSTSSCYLGWFTEATVERVGGSYTNRLEAQHRLHKRYGRTHDNSQTQLPTDQDYAISDRECQQTNKVAGLESSNTRALTGFTGSITRTDGTSVNNGLPADGPLRHADTRQHRDAGTRVDQHRVVTPALVVLLHNGRSSRAPSATSRRS